MADDGCDICRPVATELSDGHTACGNALDDLFMRDLVVRRGTMARRLADEHVIGAVEHSLIPEKRVAAAPAECVRLKDDGQTLVREVQTNGVDRGARLFPRRAKTFIEWNR